MTDIALPDKADLEGVIADYFDALVPELRFSTQRELIISRCLPAFVRLVEMMELVGTQGEIENQLLNEFMKDMLCTLSARYAGEHIHAAGVTTH